MFMEIEDTSPIIITRFIMEYKYLTKSKKRTYSKYHVNLLDHINLEAASDQEVTNLLLATIERLGTEKVIAVFSYSHKLNHTNG